MRTEFNKNIETRINNESATISKKIETQVNELKTAINNKIETKVNTVKAELNQQIERRVNEEKNTNIDINSLATGKVADNITANIRKDVDAKFSDINSSISSLERKFNGQFESFRVDFRSEVVATVLNQVTRLIEEKTKLEIAKVDFNSYLSQIDIKATQYLQQLHQLEVNLIGRINQGDMHLYNWVLEQLIALKGCIADRQVLVDQLAYFSNELKNKLDEAPCVDPISIQPWDPLLGGVDAVLPEGQNNPILQPSKKAGSK